MNEAVRISGLVKNYGRAEALRGFNLSLSKGEFVGILGANGAGKTTAIECALGMRKKDSGEVRILGMDPVRDRRRMFERVGVQFQDTAYQDKIRVGEALAYQAALYEKAADWREILARLSLTGKDNSLVSELSGGERQKLSVALALVGNPELLFLDELTTGLDPRSRRTTWDYLLERKAAGTSAVLASHFMDEVEYLCDAIVVLRKGEIVETGTSEAIKRAHGAKTLEDAFLAIAEEGELMTSGEDC